MKQPSFWQEWGAVGTFIVTIVGAVLGIAVAAGRNLMRINVIQDTQRKVIGRVEALEKEAELLREHLSSQLAQTAIETSNRLTKLETASTFQGEQFRIQGEVLRAIGLKMDRLMEDGCYRAHEFHEAKK